MTRHGFTELAKEHDELILVERPKVVQGITIAAAEGDRSENAEYIYGKKRLRELDKRLRYLGTLLKDVQLIDPATLRGDRVCFGSTVLVRDEHDVEKSYTLVGEGETEFLAGSISYKSPVARALIGKRVGDVIVAQRPAGEIELEIIGLLFAGRPWENQGG
ncbi:MAG: GreA/GreB family elongation factor [Proteobacteria bacterium]|nr:GreA/GreB family elongation factor [Pseudomonadota bacterium]